MKFSVGYQLVEPGDQLFSELVAESREHIAELYFPWLGMPSGRSPIGGRHGVIDPESRAVFQHDLAAIREMGVALNLLFNANCYAGEAMSKTLERQVVAVLGELQQNVGGVDSITTTSLAVAHIVKQRFPDVRTRASVNMRIGTIEGMQYLAHLFDGYCVQRDFNRNLDHLAELKAWADREGKTLSILVNSGCLRNCSGQIFHDNLVAHETEVAENENIEGFIPYTCWNLMRDRANWPVVLQSTWIRPEDLRYYEDLFDVVKLATRLHGRPHIVIRAYAERHYRGNLLDLLEPGFSPAFAPFFVDNRRFPDDWFATTSTCNRRCHACDYCRKVLDKTLVELPAATVL